MKKYLTRDNDKASAKKLHKLELKRNYWQNTFSFHLLSDYKRTEQPSKEN